MNGVFAQFRAVCPGVNHLATKRLKSVMLESLRVSLA